MQMGIHIPNNLSTPLINALTSPNPIKVQSQEALDIQNAISIISQRLKPTDQAEIRSPLFQSVQKIDDAFAIAIEKYKSALIDASAKDLIEDVCIDNLHKNPFMLREYEAYIQNSKTFDTSLSLSLIPFISWGYSPMILCCPGGLQGLFDNYKDRIEAGKSINRKKWATWVSIEEERRISDCLTLVKKRVQVLTKEITESNEQGFLDQDAIDEMRQISTVFESISGNPLTISVNENQVPVNTFLWLFV